jgi:hypothetical protein
LRGRGERRGNRKIRGPIIKKYKPTDHTRQLEADLKALTSQIEQDRVDRDHG